LPARDLAQGYVSDVTRVSVAVDDEHLPTIAAVADALRKHGMEVWQVLGSLGVITGTVPEGRRPLLEAVDGVVSVDEEQTYRLPPPDSPVQ
jgi:hypothetical protein